MAENIPVFRVRYVGSASRVFLSFKGLEQHSLRDQVFMSRGHCCHCSSACLPLRSTVGTLLRLGLGMVGSQV